MSYEEMQIRCKLTRPEGVALLSVNLVSNGWRRPRAQEFLTSFGVTPEHFIPLAQHFESLSHMIGDLARRLCSPDWPAR